MIDHYDIANAMRPGHALAGAGFLFIRFLASAPKISVKHIMNERRFSGTGDAGHTSENAERKIEIDVL